MNTDDPIFVKTEGSEIKSTFGMVQMIDNLEIRIRTQLSPQQAPMDRQRRFIPLWFGFFLGFATGWALAVL